MILMSKFHKLSYRIIHFCLGLNVYSKLIELQKNEQNYFIDVGLLQKSRISELVKNAFTKSTIYKKKYAEVSIKNEMLDFDNLPTLEKIELRNSKAEDVLIGNPIIKFSRMTAGTSGIPLTIYLDREAMSTQLATRYHVYKWYGIDIGDREARFWGRPERGKIYKIKDRILNRSRFDFVSDSPEFIKNELDRFIKYKPDYIYGYSSLIVNFAKIYKNSGYNNIQLKAIICTAERVSDFQLEYLKKTFKCDVVEEYGCSEMDIIAFQCKYNKLHILSNKAYLQLDENTNDVIITDLSNKLMPLIKYRLGDITTISYEKCNCKRNLPILGKIQGRTINQIVKNGDVEICHAVKFAYLVESIVDKGFNMMQFKINKYGKTVIFIIDMDERQEKFSELLAKAFNSEFSGTFELEIIFDKIKYDNNKYSYYEDMN